MSLRVIKSKARTYREAEAEFLALAMAYRKPAKVEVFLDGELYAERTCDSLGDAERQADDLRAKFGSGFVENEDGTRSRIEVRTGYVDDGKGLRIPDNPF